MGRKRPSFIEEARRAQIISAAAATVAEVGYAQATLARIAETANVSKSVISYHFDGKDDLLMTMVSQFFDNTWTHMQQRNEAYQSFADRLLGWIGAQHEYFNAHRDEFIAMIEIVTNYRGPEGERPFADGIQQEVDALTELLSAGQKAGEFRQFDPRSTAIIIIRASEGVLGTWAMDPRNDLLTETQALLDFIDHAIRKDAS